MTDVEITIHDVAFGGAGVGRLPDGKVIFVPYTLPGELVRVRIKKSKAGFSEAELLQVLTPSPHRVSAPCSYFVACGGCQYQHIAYEEQLRIKHKQVRDTLERIGGLKQIPEIHLEAAPNPYGYRNKISVHGGDRNELGFYAHDTRTIVDVERCEIAHETINQKLATLRKSLGRPRHITIEDDVQRKDSPEGSFHQVNSVMAEKMLGWIRSQLSGGESSKSTKLLDLYCGSGFFTLGLADIFGAVCGVDRDSRAIHAATVRSKVLGIGNAQFLLASVEDQLEWLLKGNPGESFTLMVDPPREGLPKNVTSIIHEKQGTPLIYVSCNPATLARDLKRLLEGRSESNLIKAIGIFDMFPQTAHIETVVLLNT